MLRDRSGEGERFGGVKRKRRAFDVQSGSGVRKRIQPTTTILANEARRREQILGGGQKS